MLPYSLAIDKDILHRGGSVQEEVVTESRVHLAGGQDMAIPTCGLIRKARLPEYMGNSYRNPRGVLWRRFQELFFLRCLFGKFPIHQRFAYVR